MKGTENTYKQMRAITEQVQLLKRMAIFFYIKVTEQVFARQIDWQFKF